MMRSSSRMKITRNRRRERANSYEKMMKTLLLQNQQIIIQQQNMMFMVMKQLQPNSNQSSNSQSQPQPLQQHQNHNLHHQQQHDSHHQMQHLSQNHHQLVQGDQAHLQSHQLFSQHSTNSENMDTQQQMQQVNSHLQENIGNYLTPAASEQDPINDKPDDDVDLVALLEGDGLLQNNLLYNPQTDIGSITPFKSNQPQHQTPSYYSSGCESLATPRVEPQRQLTTTNISQNVVKNLADSFKSPTKPKINVQILSGSATGSMKNSKAKIIQRMNISEFLRHIHPEQEETQKNSSQ